jgi:Ca-activated chloride channel family protein
MHRFLRTAVLVVGGVLIILGCKSQETRDKGQKQDRVEKSIETEQKAQREEGGITAKKKVAFTKSLREVLKQSDSKVGDNMVNLDSRDYGMGYESVKDKTLAPYFYVAGGDPKVDRLPLKETSAEVSIAGVIAQVRVNQVFANEGEKTIEAVYVFPASTRASVHGMRMKIGSRTIEARIEEREEARKEYEQAKTEGKRASLLEQQRPNVFTMNVANIMPKDIIKVELDYSELLIPEDGTYEFVYPTVVGPRYEGGADQEKDKWISNPYLHEGEKETYKFDIKIHLETGIPLKDVMSPSHKVAVDFLSPSSANVRLDEPGGGNKDFVLRYKLAGEKIETGMLTYSDGEENYFIVMMEPPSRPLESEIPPREYIFIQDVSGSMHGFPLETSKELMKKLLSSLRPSDYFNLVLFSGASYVMSDESLPATEANISKAVSLLEQQRGGGGTELMDALRSAYSIPKPSEKGLSRIVVVCTDGYVGVESQAFKFIRENLSEANLFAFGIGTSVNRALIEGMARAGMGESFVVLNSSEALKEAEKFKRYIEFPVLTNIEVQFDGIEVYDVIPEKVPDLMALRPIVLLGKWKGDAAKGKVMVKGKTGRQDFMAMTEFSKAEASKRTRPLPVLWARKWVSILEDELAMVPEDRELKEAITAIGLQYSILTPFTSFVAVDSEVVNKGGGQTTVKQPLPLPEGVSDLAVGGGGGYGLAKMATPARVVSAEPSQKLMKVASPIVGLVSFVAEPPTVVNDAQEKARITTRVLSTLRTIVQGKMQGNEIPESSLPLTLEITIDFKEDGSVASVKITGGDRYGIEKALQSSLAKFSVKTGIKWVKIRVRVSLW